jgi:urea transport system permease protein
VTIGLLRTRAILSVLAFTLVAAPALTVAGVVEPFTLNRLGRYLCFAIAALGVDLIWGFAGVLTLCHALFFCLGAYAIAMHLSLPGGGGDVRPEYNNIPQFFFFNNVDVLPEWWTPFASLPFAVAAALVIPALLAGAVGFFIFRNRVRGVYFSIITQALAWGAFLAFSRNELLLGGTNGLTNFYRPLNSDVRWIVGLYLAAAVVLVAALELCRRLAASRFGRTLVAIRDDETKLRFMGYRPHVYKALAFALSALLAAIGGMLYVPQNGIITPNVMRVEDSIWMVIWVAVGGRGRLWGAVAGAILASFVYSMLTSDMPRAWPFIQAALFLTVLVFPEGLSQLWLKLESEVAAGARVARPVAAFIFVIIFLISDKVEWLPRALSLTDLAGIPAKYWVLVMASTTIGWSRYARSLMPVLALSGLVIGEALGLFPSEMRVTKYLIVALLCGHYALRESMGSSRLPAGFWRPRAAGSNA